MKLILLIAVAAVAGALAGSTLAGCAAEPVRTDQVEVRELRSGPDGIVIVIHDPVAKVTCWKAGAAMYCIPDKEL